MRLIEREDVADDGGAFEQRDCRIVRVTMRERAQQRRLVECCEHVLAQTRVSADGVIDARQPRTIEDCFREYRRFFAVVIAAHRRPPSILNRMRPCSKWSGLFATWTISNGVTSSFSINDSGMSSGASVISTKLTPCCESHRRMLIESTRPTPVTRNARPINWLAYSGWPKVQLSG